MDEKAVDIEQLMQFSPLDGLKAENLHALAKKTSMRELPAGRLLFREGDNDKKTYFLVAGAVELRANDKIVTLVRGSTAEARNPACPFAAAALYPRAPSRPSNTSRSTATCSM